MAKKKRGPSEGGAANSLTSMGGNSRCKGMENVGSEDRIERRIKTCVKAREKGKRPGNEGEYSGKVSIVRAAKIKGRRVGLKTP